MEPQSTIMGATIAPPAPDRTPPAPDRPDFTRELSDPQREAVMHVQGPAVVFSGAGSGKTRVIVHRIAHLITFHDVRPSRICALTFTHKAAKEMKSRAVNLHPACAQAQISTFHSAAARWLREFANLLGYDPQYSILDVKESSAVLKEILKEIDRLGLSSQKEGDDDLAVLSGGESSDEDDHPVVAVDDEDADDAKDAAKGKDGLKTYLNCMSQMKMKGLTPNDRGCEDYCRTNGPLGMYKVYIEYQRILKERNCMDFADLLLNILTLLRTNVHVRETLQRRYAFMLVDEYQDVNGTQFELISLLCGPPYNLMVVGDDDQSIYSWRGADPKNILQFTENYRNARVIKLEQNYRSTGRIIESANAVIGNNVVRAPKRLWTASPPGDPITWLKVYDGAKEAEVVTSLIRCEQKEHPYPDVAIFYRTNAQSREIEDALRQRNIPYKIYGSLRFYDRAEIKDMISYLRLSVNHKDDGALMRVLKCPPRGLGKKTMEGYALLARSLGVSLYGAFEYVAMNPGGGQLTAHLSRRAMNKGIQLYDELSSLFKEFNKNPLGQAVSLILGQVNYLGHLKKLYPEQHEDKVANVQELAAAMSAYCEHNPDDTLYEWLQSVSLIGSEKEEVQGVSLMTLHSAKGLEFPRVYLVGCDEGLLPHSNSTSKDEALEEERRLMYVGITRAKKKLTLLTADVRRVYYEWRCFGPSRFLKEIPKQHLEILQAID